MRALGNRTGRGSGGLHSHSSSVSMWSHLLSPARGNGLSFLSWWTYIYSKSWPGGKRDGYQRSSHTRVFIALKEAELCGLLIANLALPGPASVDREFPSKTSQVWGAGYSGWESIGLSLCSCSHREQRMVRSLVWIPDKSIKSRCLEFQRQRTEPACEGPLC